MKPGRSVRSPRSITVAPVGARTPTARILPSCTRTTGFFFGGAPVPSIRSPAFTATISEASAGDTAAIRIEANAATRAGRPRRARIVRGPPSAAGGGVELVRVPPVDHVPPRLDVVGAAVLVLEVVGVLPHVEPEHRPPAFHDRVVLVRSRLDRKLAVLERQPRPARAEAAGPGGGELDLELRERSEGGDDRLAEVARRLAAASLLHQLPEHRVVVVSAAVVPHRGADGVRDLTQIGDQGLDRLRGESTGRLEGLVEVRHVGGVVLAVM